MTIDELLSNDSASKNSEGKQFIEMFHNIPGCGEDYYLDAISRLVSIAE